MPSSLSTINFWRFVQQYRGMLMAAGIVALPIVLIIPIPPLLLDFLLALNLTTAIIVMLTTIYVPRPLEFSVFPSLLLVTTLFRLVLNVASTRLILSNAQDKEVAAGYVIKAFGDFVAGANPLVGFVIFAILVVIQFVVITKGATRISEVAARFTLDAMPGKQMAIDADLNAGIVNEEQARARRDEIMREADFYGAMDGASKFVRGDAIAGIIITVINILGGLILGMTMFHLGFWEAVQVFTKLTIGDGLVSQIPAFIISIAAAMIVTRAASEVQLGEELISQLLTQPKALALTAGFLAVLGLTGLPVLPMFVLAALSGGGAWMTWKGQQVKVQKIQQEEKKKERIKKPEKVEEYLKIDPMEIVIGYGLIRLVDASQGGDLMDRISLIRKQQALDLGVVIPPIRIRDNVQLDSNQYQIKIQGVKVAQGTIMPEHFLAMDAGGVSGPLEGIPTKEPAFGLPAHWICESLKSKAEALGYTVVEATSVLATHLTEVIKNQSSLLLGREAVNSLIDNLKLSHPKLVEEMTKSTLLTAGKLQKVLQALLRERVSVRNLPLIIETLLDYLPRTQNEEVLTEYVRHQLGREICQQYLERDGKIHVAMMDPALEELIKAGTEHTEHNSFLTLRSDMVESVVEGISRQVSRLLGQGHTPVLLVSPQVRFQVRKMVDGMVPPVPVLSLNEIVRDVEIVNVGMVHREVVEEPAAVGGRK